MARTSFTVSIHGDLADWVNQIVTDKRQAVQDRAASEDWNEEELDDAMHELSKAKVVREMLHDYREMKVREEQLQDLMEAFNDGPIRKEEEGVNLGALALGSGLSQSTPGGVHHD